MSENDGTTHRRSWFWAFEALHQKRPGVPASVSRLRGVKVADTVLYRDNEPVAWIFTSKDGEVLRRHTKNCRTDVAVEGIVRRSLEGAAASGRTSKSRYACVVRRGSDSSTDVKAQLLNDEDIASAAGEGGGLTSNLLALQSCVHSRSTMGTRYRCEFHRPAGGLMVKCSVQRLCYLGVETSSGTPHPRSVAGSKLGVPPAFSLKSAATEINRSLEGLGMIVISHIEAVGRMKIASMHIDFVHDAASDAPVLVSIPLLETTALPKPPLRDTSGALSFEHTNSAALATLLSASGVKLSSSTHTESTESPSSQSCTPAALSAFSRGGSRPQSAIAKECMTSAPTMRAADGGLLTSIAGAARNNLQRKASSGSFLKAEIGRAGSASELIRRPHKPVPSRSGSTTDILSMPSTAIQSRQLLNKPNRVASASGGLRPTPWLRLHSPLPFAFEEGVDPLKAKKVHVCCGDFCGIKKPDYGEPRDESSADAVAAEKSTTRGLAACVVPYRSVLLARAEHAMPRLAANSEAAALLRASLLQQGRPGRAHPKGPQQISPSEYYSTASVCHACYVVYCRLDAQRARTEMPEAPHRRPLLTSAPATPATTDGVQAHGVPRPRSSAPLRTAAPDTVRASKSSRGESEDVDEMPLWKCSSERSLSRAASAPSMPGPGTRRRMPSQPMHLEYALLDSADALGARETKRLLHEMQRRPTVMMPSPTSGLPDAPSAVVSNALKAVPWDTHAGAASVAELNGAGRVAAQASDNAGKKDARGNHGSGTEAPSLRRPKWDSCTAVPAVTPSVPAANRHPSRSPQSVSSSQRPSRGPRASSKHKRGGASLAELAELEPLEAIQTNVEELSRVAKAPTEAEIVSYLVA